MAALGVSGTNCAVFVVFPLWLPPEFSLLGFFVTSAALVTGLAICIVDSNLVREDELLLLLVKVAG